MILKNATILNDEFKFIKNDIKYEHEKIIEISPEIIGDVSVDTTGFFIVPSLVDIHIHGSYGTEFITGDYDSLNKMSRYLSKNGIGNYLLASTTVSYERLKKAMIKMRGIIERGVEGANLEGIYMESCFFSKKCRGSHNEKYLRKPTISEYKEFQQASGNNIKLVSVAPELDENFEFIKAIKDEVTLSLAHSSADYGTAKKSIQSGISNVTHTFNGMLGLHHREPNAVGAALESDITAEVIADGVHLHSTIVKLIYQILGKDRMVLVSDNTRTTGLEDGNYFFEKEGYLIKDGITRIKAGNLSGGTKPLIQCVKNVIKWGIKAEDAFKMATINPCKVAKIDNKTGSIQIGKNADLLILDNNLDVKATIVKGKIVYGQLPKLLQKY